MLSTWSTTSFKRQRNRPREMVTFKQISLSVNEYEGLLRQLQVARSLLQQSEDNVHAIELQLQNIVTNNLDADIVQDNLVAAQAKRDLRQNEVGQLEGACNNRKAAIQTDMRDFRFLNTCYLKDGRDVVAIHKFLRWINPQDVPPGQHLRYKFARICSQDFLEVARVAAELQVDLPQLPGQRVLDEVMLRTPVGGEVNTPGAVA